MSTFEIFSPSGTKLDENAQPTPYDGVRFDSLEEVRTWVKRMVRKERLGWVVAFEENHGYFRYFEEHMIPHGIEWEWFDCYAVQAKEYPDVGLETYYWRYTRKGWALKCEDGKWVLMDE